MGLGSHRGSFALTTVAVGLLVSAGLVGCKPTTDAPADDVVLDVRGFMEPTVKAGEYPEIDRNAYSPTSEHPPLPPTVGEVVQYYPDPQSFESHIRRVVAMPGQEWYLDEGAVIIDGQVLSEPYVVYGKDVDVSTEPSIVESGTVVVMPDNREWVTHPMSLDLWGPIPVTSIVGRALVD